LTFEVGPHLGAVLAMVIIAASVAVIVWLLLRNR